MHTWVQTKWDRCWKFYYSSGQHSRKSFNPKTAYLCHRGFYHTVTSSIIPVCWMHPHDSWFRHVTTISQCPAQRHTATIFNLFQHKSAENVSILKSLRTSASNAICSIPCNKLNQHRYKQPPLRSIWIISWR